MRLNFDYDKMAIDYQKSAYFPNMIYWGHDFNGFIDKNIGFIGSQEMNSVYMDYMGGLYNQAKDRVIPFGIKPKTLSTYIKEDSIRYNPFLINYSGVSVDYTHTFKRIHHIVNIIKHYTGKYITNMVNKDEYLLLVISYMCAFASPSETGFPLLIRLLSESDNFYTLLNDAFYDIEDEDSLMKLNIIRNDFFNNSQILLQALRQTFCTDAFLRATTTEVEYFSEQFWNSGEVVFVNYSSNTSDPNNALASFFIDGLYDYTVNFVKIYAGMKLNAVYSYYIVPDYVYIPELEDSVDKLVDTCTANILMTSSFTKFDSYSRCANALIMTEPLTDTEFDYFNSLNLSLREEGNQIIMI